MHLVVGYHLEFVLELKSHVMNGKRHSCDSYDERNDYQYADTNYSTRNVIAFSGTFILKISHLKEASILA